MPSFNDFLLQPATLAVLTNMGITEPTPIQAQAIPALLAGNDLVGQSATGSGKTLAYGIPLLERLSKDKRVVQALVVVPTRELAVQVNTVLSKLAASKRLSTALLVGGRPYGNQISALRYGSQIVVGTPGRIKDHLDRGTLVLSQLRICVLDEADQMLDIGFAPIIEEILTTTPDTRQMALFSATMPEWITKLQEKFLKDPVKVDITLAAGEQSTIEQIAYQVPHEQKMAALCTLLHSTQGESSLIFGKTKFGVEKLGKQLSKLGFAVGTLHGNKSQRARDEVLTAFRNGQVQTLLATNVAARGLDITGIYQVINYELPESSDLFTHRIGRTGRMGRQGKAITLLVPSDLPKWRRMARSLGQVVALQKLAINEEAMVTMALARPEIVLPQEREQSYEQNYEQRSGGRGRKQFSSGPDRSRSAMPRYESHPVASVTRRPSDTVGDAMPPRITRRPGDTVGDAMAPRITRRPNDNAGEGMPPRITRRPSEAMPAYTSAMPSEGFTSSERSSSSEGRDGRRAVGKPSGRSMGKHNARSFGPSEPQNRVGRRNPRAAQTTRVRRGATTSNRSTRG